jgi:hypothetical protein
MAVIVIWKHILNPLINSLIRRFINHNFGNDFKRA